MLFTLRRTFYQIIFAIITQTILLPFAFPGHTNRKTKHNTGLKLKDDIVKYKTAWCNVRMARYDWKKILSPCGSHIAWNDHSWKSMQHTDARKSRIKNVQIKPAGFFSKFIIHSVTVHGMSKTFGGDSWRVDIRGPASMAAQVFDRNDGTYEVVFLPMEPGHYKASVVLDYSLCNGMKDPPLDWFRKGCRHGSFQPHGSLGNQVHDFVQQPIQGEKFEFVVPKPLPSRSAYVELEGFKAASQEACKERCNLLWDGYGRWTSTQQWKPYSTHFPWQLARTTSGHSKGRGVLWIYGDSINRYFFDSLLRRPLCHHVFRACYHTMAWVYVLTQNANEEMDLRNGGRNLNIPRILDELRTVVSRSDMDENSALVLNAGVHLLKSTTFYYYQKIINGFIEILRKYYRGKVIWKTITSVHDQSELYSGCFRRFHTEQRVQLFNAYSRSAFCKAGYLVVDVYPISASYPGGTLDGVHYNNSVFHPAEEVLEQYFGT